MTTEQARQKRKRPAPQELTLGQWIERNCRVQKDAERLLDVSEQNIGRIRRGEQEPKADTLGHIVYGTLALYEAGTTEGIVPLWALLSDDVRIKLFGPKRQP
jgi:hypothetical protein